MITVIHVGPGPIGAAVAAQIAARKGFRIVGPRCRDRQTCRRRGEVGVDIGKTIRASKPAVASWRARVVRLGLIDGLPRVYSKIDGGVHRDISTASITVNSIAAVLAAAPGPRPDERHASPVVRRRAVLTARVRVQFLGAIGAIGRVAPGTVSSGLYQLTE